MIISPFFFRAWPLLLVLAGTFGFSATESNLSGTIKDRSGRPVRDATVLILELKRRSTVDRDGTYRFEEVPPGTYTLQIASGNFGTKIQTVSLAAGDNTMDLVFDVAVHEEVTVTASLQRINISDAAQAVDVLNEDLLKIKVQPTLGETLAAQPGVTSSYFGPAASRPVIRGLGGDRIRILEGGIATGDVSSVSADHAVSVDISSSERVEVLRGPASLRYGSSAVGGVVNVLDNRIPSSLTESPLNGSLSLRGNTVADERTGGANLEGSHGHFAWHLDLTRTDTHDTEIPDAALSVPEGAMGQETRSGILENSAQEIRKSAAGASLIFDRGFFGVAFTDYKSFYGIPGQAPVEEGAPGEEEPVSIDLVQRRVDLHGGVKLASGTLKMLDFRMATTDYRHTELEGESPGTVFNNDYLETRIEISHDRLGPFSSGSFGLQYVTRDFSAIGEEAFVPPNDMTQIAAYLYQEKEKGNLALTLGARLEHQTNQGTFSGTLSSDDDIDAAPADIDISFNGLSGAVGILVGKQHPYSFALNLTHTERSPTPEELLSHGPHLATSAFEIGNPDFGKERSLGADLVLRKKEGRLTGELNLFANQFDDFIYERATGEFEDGLQVFQFSQDGAEFRGGELHLDLDLVHVEPHHLSLELAYDFVQAKLDRDGDLPRIPPERVGISLTYRRPGFWASTEVRHTGKQDRLAEYETPTDHYLFWNATSGYQFFIAKTVHQVTLNGTNLSDAVGRNHTSFLKDRVPLPGRNLTLSYLVRF